MDAKHASRSAHLILVGSAAFLLACAGKGPASNNMLPPGAEPCAAVPSKTPRAPRLLWSCERANMLEKLRASNHPQWQELVASADRTGTGSQRYGDNGGFAALVYQVSGDVSYAKKGYAAAMKELSQHVGFDYNFTRGMWAEYAILYDYLQGGITEDERKAMAAILYGWVDAFFALDPKTPIRTVDTDQTTGNYFGIMLTALATQGSDPRADALLTNSFVGGFDATAADLTTLRNAVHKYITEWAAGGIWMESGYYDVETLQLVAQGVEAMRNATGTEHFPEYAAFAEQVVRAQVAQLTPDLKTAVQWGDTEDARDFQAWRRYQTLGMFTGTLPPASPMRPIGTALTNELKERYKNDPIYQSRYYYYFDPSAPTVDFRTLPLSHYASGQGMVFARDGWGPTDSLLFMHLRRPPMNVDHENAQFGHFELYRRGGWAITHPVGYGGGCLEPVSVNAMVVGGLDSMIERSVIGQSAAADGSYVYFAGSTKGARYIEPYYDPPTNFVSEWSRAFLYLPTTNRAADTLVIYDRVDAVAPTKLDRYTAADRARIQAAPKLKQWILHTPVSPSQSASGASWDSSGQKVALTTLAPAQRDVSIVDEKTLGWPTNFPMDSERHFYMAISPKVDQAYDTFLNVLQVSDAAIATPPTRVASTDNGMEGALITRPGQLDAVALFSATRGARLRTAGFSFTVNVTTSAIDLFVSDLDPAKKWKAGGVDLPVDAGGLAHLLVTGSGSQSIAVTVE